MGRLCKGGKMMGALANAKQAGREAVLAKIKEAGLWEFGLKKEALSDKFERAAEGAAVEAGLNNADTDKVLLGLLKDTPEKVLEGIAVAGFLTGTESLSLYLPESETELTEALKDKAEAYGIQLFNEIINVRAAGDAVLLHIVTAADLADLMDGCYQKGVYVSVDGAPLQKKAADTGIGELVSLGSAKAVKLGYRYYTPTEAESLTAADATTGLIHVLTDKDCIVAETRDQMTEYRKVSCGKCVFCREGLIQLEYEQKETTQARGKMEFLDLTKEIGDAMKFSCLCSVGQEAAKAALDATEKFTEEYEAHIRKNKCPAGVCTAFVHIYIDPHTCTGCGECLDVCPADCIEGKDKYIHMIDEFDCTRCGKCIEACEEGAVIQTAGKLPKLPNRLTKVGKFRRH